MWEEIWTGVRAEFLDLPRGVEVAKLIVRLLVAALLGGALGYERERSGKSAGVRTHMLVAMGSAFFVLIPERAGMEFEDLSRIIQGLTAGIGFIGAGSILKQSEQGRVQGLTTAAGIWMTAAVGTAVGLGREASAVLGTFLTLLILRAVHFRVSGNRPEDSETNA